MSTLALLGRLFLKGTLWDMARSQDTVILAHELPPLSACLPVPVPNPYKKQLEVDALIRHLVMQPPDVAEMNTGLLGI